MGYEESHLPLPSSQPIPLPATLSTCLSSSFPLFYPTAHPPQHSRKWWQLPLSPPFPCPPAVPYLAYMTALPLSPMAGHVLRDLIFLSIFFNFQDFSSNLGFSPSL
ncbi:UNVERIFIED_CONTAM: hypothetical protein K2H54_031409 [Gekko kuhli]